MHYPCKVPSTESSYVSHDDRFAALQVVMLFVSASRTKQRYYYATNAA